MDSMEYIDEYFKSSPTGEQRQAFEQRIINDMSFAEEVAFYISANGAIQEQLHQEKKQLFRELYEQRKVIPMTSRPLKKIVRYLAAASVVAIAFLSVWVFNGNKNLPAQLASEYAQENWQTIPGTMDGKQDSMQSAIALFNDGKFPEALTQFETILKNDSTNSSAKRDAGIVAFNLGQYDKAQVYFALLAADTLRDNPGKLLEAVVLLKRNNPGDLEQAKKLLKEVTEEGLQGKAKAEKWLELLKNFK